MMATFRGRILRAAKLDVNLHEEVEADTGGTRQARMLLDLMGSEVVPLPAGAVADEAAALEKQVLGFAPYGGPPGLLFTELKPMSQLAAMEFDREERRVALKSLEALYASELRSLDLASARLVTLSVCKRGALSRGTGGRAVRADSGADSGGRGERAEHAVAGGRRVRSRFHGRVLPAPRRRRSGRDVPQGVLEVHRRKGAHPPLGRVRPRGPWTTVRPGLTVRGKVPAR